MRLIDADEVKDLINSWDSLPFEEEVDELVDRIPTAFDVDKVVEELEDELRYICLIEGLDYKEFREAIDVVKAGGIDGNSKNNSSS